MSGRMTNDLLTSMGQAWFILYEYNLRVDKHERRYLNCTARGLEIRQSAYAQATDADKYGWLVQCKNYSGNNNLGADSYEIRRMAQELLNEYDDGR